MSRKKDEQEKKKEKNNEENLSSSEETNVPDTSEDVNNCSDDDKKTEPEKIITEEEYQELSDKFVRLAAEYDNFRKRSQKEKESIYTDSVASVTSSWLPVIDNLERAVFVSENYETEEAKKIAKGVEMIVLQAKEVMEGLGVTEIDALGNKFNPEKMEAVMHIEDDSAEESEVVEVFTKGYEKGDKVIRHAIVKVAN